MTFGGFAASRSFAALVLACALAASIGCDEPPGTKAGASASATSATTVAVAAPSATAAPLPKAFPMPPRPVPLGSSGPVQPSAPPEQQMMAIGYTIAMVSPRPSDPDVDAGYVESITKKLDAAARTADKGKTPPNPVKATKGSRKLEIELGKGCNERTPVNLLVQRAGSSLKAAFDAGVLVVMCHDDKWECHQATRDPADVLCLAAPRR